jgi:hypothetical protein
MPITPFLGDISFDPETKRVMGLAFEMARIALGLDDRTGTANEVIAKQIIELAKLGERTRSFVRSRAEGISPAAAVARACAH